MTDSSGGWVQIGIRVASSQVDAAEALLDECQATAITLLDAEDHPVHEPGPGETPLWPDVLVRGLFNTSVDRQLVLDALLSAGLVRRPELITCEALPDQDWERAWMDQYQPLQFGRNLWICPSHIEPDPAWPVVIRLDPGLAFGSGTHPTTALCLEWIDGLALADHSIVDYGCGSGILAIACALKGATRIVAVDHDPQALLATADNAHRNGQSDTLKCALPGDFEPFPADCVLANILAGPLIELAPLLVRCIRPGGQLVLSGILREQAAGVINAYLACNLKLQDHSEREDWVRLVLTAAS